MATADAFSWVSFDSRQSGKGDVNTYLMLQKNTRGSTWGAASPSQGFPEPGWGHRWNSRPPEDSSQRMVGMSQFHIHGWADVTVTVSIKPKTGFPTSFGYIQKFQALFTGNPCELHLRKVFPAFFVSLMRRKHS